MRWIQLCSTVACSAFVSHGAHAQSRSIPIVNPGFESISRPLADGEQTNGIGGADEFVGTRLPFPFGVGIVDWSFPVTVPGWRTRTVPFGSPGEVWAGVLRPGDLDGVPFVTGFEGEYVLAVQAALAGQRTSETLKPNTTYTLSFSGGISQFDSDYFFSATLTAIDDSVSLPIEQQPGVTRLALGSFLPPNNIPDGVMRRYEFSFTTPETLAPDLVGDRLGITVFGSDGLPRVVYDDFQLTADSGAGCSLADLAEPFGILNFFDLGAFLTLYNAQDAAADLAPPALVWNFFDLGQFLTIFQNGCP